MVIWMSVPCFGVARHLLLSRDISEHQLWKGSNLRAFLFLCFSSPLTKSWNVVSIDDAIFSSLLSRNSKNKYHRKYSMQEEVLQAAQNRRDVRKDRSSSKIYSFTRKKGIFLSFFSQQETLCPPYSPKETSRYWNITDIFFKELLIKIKLSMPCSVFVRHQERLLKLSLRGLLNIIICSQSS